MRGLWRVDLASGERRLLVGPQDEPDEPADRAEQLRRERTRTYARGVTRYAWSGTAERPVLLVPLGGEWLVGVGSDPDLSALRALDGATEAHLAPDGRSVAFVRDGDVWIVATEGEAQPRRLTHDAGDGVTNGVAEYIAAEELKRFDGAWWSTDGAHLAIARVDERHVDEVVIAHIGTSDELERHRYPQPGRPNAHVTLRVASVATGALRDAALPFEPGDYLARVVALPNGAFLVAVLPRAQDELRWVTVHGDGTVEPGWTERGARWINLDDDTRPLDDGRILRTTERSGYRHLEIREPGAEPRALTSGPWVVTGVVGVDERRAEAVVVGTLDGATQRHVYAVSLAGGAPRRLSAEPGWHEAVLAPDASSWVDTWSSLESAPRVVLRDRERGDILHELHAATATAGGLGLPPPELLELRAADGTTTVHAALYPARGDGGRAPLTVSTYGGPHSQRVKDHWSLTADLTAQLLAQRGIAVLAVDNRGTYNRGTAFEAALHRRLGGVEVEDTTAAVRQLVERGLVDPERVGIMGWSYGGFVVLKSMLAEPDLYRVGVAGAPVVAWELYDSAYTERYLGDPATEPDAYRASGVPSTIDALRGRVLVIHGLIDENVHLRHTAQLLAALVDSDRDHDVLLLPGERHGIRGEAALRHRARRTIEYLEAHLLPGP